MLILIMKNITNNTMYTVQEDLHSFLQPYCIILAILTLSIYLLHSSTNVSTSFFLHLQFL